MSIYRLVGTTWLFQHYGINGAAAAIATFGLLIAITGVVTMRRTWLKRRYVTALIGARFMPGFRFPTYAASGFLNLPFWPFASVAFGAGMVWTTLIFSLVFFFGVMIVENLGVWRWALAAALVAFILAGPMLAERFARPRADADHD